MTTRCYNAITAGQTIRLCAFGRDEPTRRSNAIVAFRELWPDITLLRLEPAGDWS